MWVCVYVCKDTHSWQVCTVNKELAYRFCIYDLTQRYELDRVINTAPSEDRLFIHYRVKLHKPSLCCTH